MTTWRSTKPDSKLDYRCDLCGEPANTIHFVPWSGQCDEVLFACPDHDPGGYWLDLDRFWTNEMQDHLFHDWERSERQIGLLGARVDEARRRDNESLSRVSS